ncbi:hypothetical protein BOTBODRAFT_35668 [Botryobasidium botryosum FD-172 SS1]|uniref:Uncharacterized protein n=1 Tax=Botryobasidium botryosum (strain FD-172 SS1) TaxID=930990 RepID=A0A067M8V4_BOTB1|nr:hypothetical protein BOTBODRAFT_35668 [Botryobasidium botryosum FD-172 SS1]
MSSSENSYLWAVAALALSSSDDSVICTEKHIWVTRNPESHDGDLRFERHILQGRYTSKYSRPEVSVKVLAARKAVP